MCRIKRNETKKEMIRVVRSKEGEVSIDPCSQKAGSWRLCLN